MRASVASLSRKVVAALVAFVLTFSMVPLAWADDGPAGTVAGTVAGSAAESRRRSWHGRPGRHSRLGRAGSGS